MSTGKRGVNVHSKLTVVSSKPIVPGKTHPLSALDHSMGLHTLHIVFYYEENPFGSFELDPLRESLSEVLSLYPPVTGRLTGTENGNWEVKCNDAGLRATRAKVGVTLDEWLRSANASEERALTVWEDMPEDSSTWSPFRLQVCCLCFFFVDFFSSNELYSTRFVRFFDSLCQLILWGFFFFYSNYLLEHSRNIHLNDYWANVPLFPFQAYECLFFKICFWAWMSP